MSTFQITLPDQLAQEAERAGLLSSEAVEKFLRDQLKSKRVAQLFSAMDRMSAADSSALTPEEVAVEIAAVRTERRARRT